MHAVQSDRTLKASFDQPVICFVDLFTQKEEGLVSSLCAFFADVGAGIAPWKPRSVKEPFVTNAKKAIIFLCTVVNPQIGQVRS